jgi:hypothetical protein
MPLLAGVDGPLLDGAVRRRAGLVDGRLAERIAIDLLVIDDFARAR